MAVFGSAVTAGNVANAACGGCDDLYQDFVNKLPKHGRFTDANCQELFNALRLYMKCAGVGDEVNNFQFNRTLTDVCTQFGN